MNLSQPLALAVAFLASVVPFARATDSALDASFVSTISPGLTPDSYPTFDTGTGAVNAVALQPDGKILVGGNVSRYQAPAAGSPQTSLKRLNPDGSLDTATGFNTFAATLAVTSGQTEVNAILPVAGDKLYLGGVFTSYQGTARSCVLRLNADGSLDTAFNAAGISNSSPLGGRYVLALAEQADGNLLVGGFFNRANGTYRPNLARFLADGSLDTGFDPAAALASSSFIGDIAVLPNGQIVVAGGRTRAGGGSTPLLVRLNADGSADPGFAPAFADDYGDIDELLVLPDGRIVVGGGDFAFANQYVACFLPDGSLDAAFMANLGSGPNGWAGGELALQPDGTILVGGIFNSWNGQPRASIARLQPDGTLDPALAVLPYMADRNNYLTHFYSFATQPDGKLVVGGWFSRVTDPVLQTYNLTRITNEFSAASPGTLRLVSTSVSTAENTSSVTLQISRFGGLNGAVSVNFATLTGGADGTATAASDYTTSTGTLSWAAGEGGFKTVTVPLLQDSTDEGSETFTVSLSGVTGGAILPIASSRATVTIRDDDSAPVITSSPSPVSLEQGAGFTLSVRYDSVLPATVQWQRDPDGAGPLPFADIASATGMNYGVANADPATHAGDYRAVVTNQPNGSPASATSGVATVSISVPAGSVVTSFAPASIGSITAAAPDATGRILVLTDTGLRRLGADGVAEPTTSFGVSVTASSAYALLPLADGRILVGGSFASQTHQPSSAVTSLVRLFRVNADATGTVDTGFSAATNGPVTALAAGAGDKFYVGVMGASTSVNGLQRFLANGSADPSWTPAVNTIATGTAAQVFAIRELSDGKVLVAYTHGSTGVGGSITYNLARFGATGALDTSFGLAGRIVFNNHVRALDVLPDGRIAVAGSFSSAGGQTRQRVALLTPDGAVDPTFEFPSTFDTGGVPNGVLYRDGRLLVFGTFTTVNGTAQGNLARFNLDGSNDPSFSVGAGASGSFGFATNTAFYTSAGDIFIGGSFTSFKGVARNRAALLVGNPHIGAIGFAPPRVFPVETAGGLSLILRRYGPATEAVSIAWATAEGTVSPATVDVDYTAASGTVTWAAGDAADKTVVIPLLDDSLLESSETFRVLLSSPTGPVTTAASATVMLIDSDTPVAFGTQPVGSALLAGQNLALSAATSSPSPTTYQWFRNGVAVPGATSASFSKIGVTAADAGVYTLVATNAAGSVTSTPVFVGVRPQPGLPVAGQAVSGRPNFAAISASPTALVALDDGGALVGGNFSASAANAINQSYLIRIRPDGATDITFSLPINGSVNCLLRQLDGKILVGGSFTAITGNPANATRVLRLNADLSLDATFAANTGAFLSSGAVSDLALDSTGRIYVATDGGTIYRYSSDGIRDDAYAPVAAGGISALAVQADGKLLLAGSFTNVNDAAPAKYKFARLLTDGSVDTTFTNGIGSSGISGFNDLLVLADGRIFAAGSNFANGATLALVNADGSFGSNIAASNQVYRIAQAPGGKVLVTRTHSTGSSRVFRLLGTNPLPVPGSADGDATFNIGTGPDAEARALAVGPDGSVWLAGSFTTFNGTSTQGVVKLAGDPVVASIVNPPVNTPVVPGGTAYLGVGSFGSGLSYQWFKGGVPLSDGGDISGATTSLLTIANADASDDADYTVAVTGGSPAATFTSGPAHLYVLGAPVVAASPSAANIFVGANLTLAAQVYALSPATYVWRRDGVVVTDGGRFSGTSTASLTITGATTADTGTYTLTVTNALGQDAITPAFVLVSGQPADRAPAFATLSSSSTVRDFLPLPDGRMLVASSGNLSFPPSSASAAALTYVNSDGTLANLGFAPGTSTALPYVGGEIYDVVRQSDGKFVIGGSFTSVNGVAINRIARIHADGTLDTSFNPGSGAANTVNSLALDSVGRVLVGGAFTNFAGVSGQSYLVRLDPATGALDATLAAGVTGTVNKILALPDGGFLVGGGFFSPGQYLIRYDSAGVRMSSFAPNPANAVTDLVLAPGGTYFHASFTATPYLARYSLAGTADATFTLQGTQPNASVTRIAVQEDGAVVGFGTFNSPYGNVVRYRANGLLDSSFSPGSGLSSTVHALALDSAGRIWLGGNFTAYNSTPASRIVVLNGSPVALGFARQPLARSVEAGQSTTFTAEVVATAPVTWQWFKDATPLADGPGISGATTASLTLTGVVVADEGFYTVQASTPSAGPIASAPAELVFLGAPEIVTAPAGGTFEAGVARTLTVTARGAGTLSYQWFRGTASSPIADIPDATSASFTLNAPTTADTSYYGVRVTNSLGETSSAPVLLTFGTYAGSLATATLPTFNSTVNKVIPLVDGGFVAVGQFSSITPNGSGFATTRRGMARIFANGTIDTTFTPANNNPVNVTDITRDTQGRFVAIGNFNTLLNASNQNVTVNSIVRLTSAGAIDATFTSPLSSSLSNLTTVVTDSSDRIYVGGGFTNFGGTGGANYLVRLDPASGARDATFTAAVTGQVNAVCLLANGQLLVGGNFGVRRLNADGTLDNTFSYFGGLTVNAIQPVAGSTDFILGGTFTSPQRITASGSVVTPWPASGGLADGSVTEFLALDGGRTLIGGAFNNYGVSSPKIALLEADGTRSSAFNVGTGFNNTVNHLALAADGRIYAAGAFTSYRGSTVSRVVLLNAIDTIPADPGAPATANPFDEYLAEFGVPAGQRGATDDPDGDGVPNLLEFALGLDPAVGDINGDGLPVVETAGGFLTLTYVRTQPSDVIYEVQATSDLSATGSWSADGVTQGTPDAEGVTTASIPLSGPRLFLRLHVTLAP